jgi:hypothetical protein
MSAADYQPDGADLDESIRRTWNLLLNGWGFNWYRLDNQLRADDVLLRNRVRGDLDTACARLREVEAAFRRRHLPAPTRANPFPDPEKLRAANAIASLRERVAATETQVRGSPMPPNDRIWAAHRDHEATLDTRLIGTAHDMAACLDAADEADLTATLERCETLRRTLDRALASRKTLLEFAT